MRKFPIVLLNLTVVFNLVFWLMVFSGYSLSDRLFGLGVTGAVGIVAVVLLPALIVRVRQLALYRFFGVTRSPYYARLLLVLLPVLFLPIVFFFLFVLLIVLLIIYALVSPVWVSIDWHQSLLMVGSLLGIIFGYIALIFFFYWVVSVLNQAALSRSVERFLYGLQAIGLMVVLTCLVGLFHFINDSDALCSHRYQSPSGQRAIIVEDYPDSSERPYDQGGFISRSYLDGPIFRKDLGDLGYLGLVCKEEPLTLKWSADESQVDWKTPRNSQVHWQF